MSYWNQFKEAVSPSRVDYDQEEKKSFVQAGYDSCVLIVESIRNDRDFFHNKGEVPVLNEKSQVSADKALVYIASVFEGVTGIRPCVPIEYSPNVSLRFEGINLPRVG